MNTNETLFMKIHFSSTFKITFKRIQQFCVNNYVQVLMKPLLILVLKVPADRMLRTVAFHLRWDAVQNQTHTIPTDTHQALYSAAYMQIVHPPNAPCRDFVPLFLIEKAENACQLFSSSTHSDTLWGLFLEVFQGFCTYGFLLDGINNSYSNSWILLPS